MIDIAVVVYVWVSSGVSSGLDEYRFSSFEKAEEFIKMWKIKEFQLNVVISGI